MLITVILCTYNRYRTLANTLESLASSTLQTSIEWEVLVVDNNSTDQTRDVVEDFCQKYPGRFRYLLEPLQGVSYARNAGIREARGEILAFIDDDEIADPKWLEILTSNLHGDQWAGAGGRVAPPSNFSPPSWLLITSWFVSGPLASFDLGPEAGQLYEPPFGANMAFRKEVFDKCGLFRIDLGRSGNNLISNEDTELGRRVMAAGLCLRYEPSAVTYHPVEESRLGKEYFLSWWFNKGRSDVRELGDQSNRTRFLGIPLRLFRTLAGETVWWMLAVKPTRRFGHKVGVWTCAGQMLEFYLQWIEKKRTGPNHDPTI